MNGVKPTDTLNQVFGENKWGKAPVKPCRIKLGYKTLNMVSKLGNPFTRRQPITRPSKKCRCVMPPNTLCAKIMDLNPCENFFNLIEMELKKIAKACGWPKNKEQLAKRIESIIEEIPVSWYQKTFSSLPNRWKEVQRRKGDNTDFYCPKYH